MSETFVNHVMMYIHCYLVGNSSLNHVYSFICLVAVLFLYHVVLSIWPTCLDCRMGLWFRIPYLDQTLSFLGSALKLLCFILLSWPDQLVNSSCNLNRILIVQQLLCCLVQSAISSTKILIDKCC